MVDLVDDRMALLEDFIRFMLRNRVVSDIAGADIAFELPSRDTLNVLR